jgi:hypothetical protein
MNEIDLNSIIINSIKNNKLEKNRNSKEIKPSTLYIYKKQLKKIYKIINDTDNEFTMEGFYNIILNFDKLKDYLEDKNNDFSNNTKKNYINIILNMVFYIPNIEKYYDKPQEEIQEIKEKINQYWYDLVKKVNNKIFTITF